MHFMVMALRLLCVLCELCVKSDLFHGSRSPFVSGCGAFLLKISGTRDKKRANCPFFNDFPVPLNAWDKPGTRLGQGTSGTRKSFFKNREKIDINRA
jgi:hypothetical protein